MLGTGVSLTTLATTLAGPWLGGTPAPSGEYDFMASGTRSQTEMILSEFENAWAPTIPVAWDTDQLCSSAADFNTKANALTAGTGLKHRLRIAPTGDWTTGISGLMRVRGRDFQAAGGMLLIEPDTVSPNIICYLQVNGATGIWVRGLTFVRGVTTNGGDITWSPGDGGANPRDSVKCIEVTRSATFPMFSVVRIEDCNIGPVFAGITNALEFGAGIVCDYSRELQVINNRFKGLNTAIKARGTRRIIRHRNDFQLPIGDACTNFSNDLLIGSVNLRSEYPSDQRCYVWSRLNTLQNIADISDMVNSQGEDVQFWAEHTDADQYGTSTDNLDYCILSEYEAIYGERVTFKDSGGIRNVPGMQFLYCDDTSKQINVVAHNCLVAGGFVNCLATWNGESFAERMTLVRHGQLPPSATLAEDGFNDVIDPYPSFVARKLDAGKTGTLFVKDSLASDFAERSGTGYVAGTLTQVNNAVADCRIAASTTAYSNLFEGTFDRDSESRQIYDFVDDGSLTQAELRAALFAQFTPKGAAVGKGCSDPATWPSV